MILVFLILSFKLAFSLSSFTLIKRLFSSSLLSAIKVVSSAYLRLLIFVPATRWVADTLPPTEFPWFTVTLVCSLGYVSEALEEMAWVAIGWVSEEEWAGWDPAMAQFSQVSAQELQ